VCTLLGCAVENAWLLASTSDDPYAVRNQLVCDGESPYGYVAVRVATEDPASPVPWNHMLTRGLNAAGLAYTYAYVHESGNEEGPPQTWAPEMLARCASVGEAVELMRVRLGRVLSGNYLLCDARGGAAAVEVSRTALRVTPAEGGRIVCTNAWKLLPMQVVDRWGAETAALRAARAHLLLRDSSATLHALFSATRDHSDGGADIARPYGASICNHGRQEGTISAEILDPRERRLWWTYGWPCGRARGYEASGRAPWGRFIAFGAATVRVGGEVTTLDGRITPLGVGLISAVEHPSWAR
jgi:hypothetical protein